VDYEPGADTERGSLKRPRMEIDGLEVCAFGDGMVEALAEAVAPSAEPSIRTDD
jgi:hypothetical protein